MKSKLYTCRLETRKKERPVQNTSQNTRLQKAVSNKLLVSAKACEKSARIYRICSKGFHCEFLGENSLYIYSRDLAPECYLKDFPCRFFSIFSTHGRSCCHTKHSSLQLRVPI